MRFYKNKYPDIDDIAIGIPYETTDNGVYVRLPEYDDIEGMINLREVSEKRYRSIKQVITLNHEYPLLVIRVDEEKQYVDLSNKFIKKKDKYMKRFKDYKVVFNIFKSFFRELVETGKVTEEDIETYADKTIWKLKPKDIIPIFFSCKYEPEKLDAFDLTSEEKEILRKCINRSIVYDIKFDFTFELASYEFNGVEKIKGILKDMENIFAKHIDKNDFSVSVQNIPNYSITGQWTPSTEENIKKAVEEIKEYMGTVQNKFFNVKHFNCMNSLDGKKIDL